MAIQGLALAKQNVKSRLTAILDRSQSPPANFTAAQIHLGSYSLRASGQSLEETVTGAAQAFISHAQEGELALGEFRGRFTLALDLLVRSAGDSDERDWLDDMLVDLLAALDPAAWGDDASAGPPPERIRWKTETADRATRLVRLAFLLTFPWNA
ncbi:MAG: hypothetical protein ACREJ2_18235 [Planctomycetota bacterium]